MTKKQG